MTSISRCPWWSPAQNPDEELSAGRLGESEALLSQRTGAIQARVEAARAQFECSRGMLSNADALARQSLGHLRCGSTEWSKTSVPEPDTGRRNLLRAAMQQLHMSARAVPRA